MILITKNLALSLGITLALGTLSTPLGCGGSGRSLPAAFAREDAKLPEEVALHVRTCAAEHREHLRSADLSVRFELKLASDGEVDTIEMLDSTLGDEDLEACMAGALWKLSMDALPTRHSRSSERDPAAPESRMFLGQTQVLACLASPPCVLALAFLVGAAYITVQVLVHTTSQSSTAKPKPRATTTATATTMPTVDVIKLKYEKMCWPFFQECLENMDQPEWNQRDFGPLKDCKGCLQECKEHAKPRGTWPDYKCPRN